MMMMALNYEGVMLLGLAWLFVSLLLCVWLQLVLVIEQRWCGRCE
jgi:hypothetical protein